MDESPFDDLRPAPPVTETHVNPSDYGSDSPRSAIAVLIAVLAALVGVGLIGFVVYRIVADDDDGGGAAPVTTTTAVAGGGFVTIEDETGRIVVDVPEQWSDVDGSVWAVEGTDVGPALTSAVDIGDWVSGWGTPGVFIGVDDLTASTPTEVLDSLDFSEACTLQSRQVYDRGDVAGEMETYTDCGGEASTFVQVAATNPEGTPLVLVQMVLLGDTSVGTTVLDSWRVD